MCRLGSRAESMPLSTENDISNDVKLYRVRWEIEVEATTPHEAAEKARYDQTKPGTKATVFEVAQVDPYAIRRARDLVTVDLTTDTD